jgi:hypothetical protein
MSFKKFWLKAIDSKKYQILKNSKKIKQDLENFRKNYEPYLEEVFEKISSKKELSFLHSGHSGDIINTLPVIKQLSETHKCNLYIQVNKNLNSNYLNHPAENVFINEKIYNMLMPLLKNQPYLNNVEKYSNQEIDINFDIFRELPINISFDNLRYSFLITGIQPDTENEYIKASPHDEISKQIVIQRTFRYRNHFIDYNFLSKYNDLLFLGTKEEFNDLKSSINNLKFHDCKDFLEMAMIIKSSKFFIGNSSIGFPIAEGLKVPRLLEACPYFPAAQPHGKNAYDFYFQRHFKKYFNLLNK